MRRVAVASCFAAALGLAACASGSPGSEEAQPPADPSRPAAPSETAVSDSPPSTSTSPSSTPVFYAFTWEVSEENPGCGPQATFVKVLGSNVYEVTADGCDLIPDQGTIEGDRIAFVGVVQPCVEGETMTVPSTVEISGGAGDMRIPGKTRVVGPTESIDDLDEWWSAENARVAHPGEPNETQVSEWMDSAAEADWASSGC